MNRAVIFAHYDRDNLLDDYVCYYLSQLKKVSSTLVFVSTADLQEEDVVRLSGFCSKVILRENVGHDFMSYKCGLESISFSDYDEVVLCNDSVYGAFYPLTKIFEEMMPKRFSFWGITQSQEIAGHLQSYFMVFDKEVLGSRCFSDFWEGVCVLEKKKQIVSQYEVGLSRNLVEHGFKVGAYVDYCPDVKGVLSELFNSNNFLIHFCSFRQVLSLFKVLLMCTLGRCNVTHFLWRFIILNHKMPFIKIDLLRDNYLMLASVSQYESVIEQTGSTYPTALIKNHLARFLQK